MRRADVVVGEDARRIPVQSVEEIGGFLGDIQQISQETRFTTMEERNYAGKNNGAEY